MTISVVYDYQTFSAQQYGGISRYIVELAKRVDTTWGFKANIVAPTHYNAYLKTGDMAYTGFHIPKMPKTNRLYHAANRLLSPLMIRAANPDLVHETYYARNHTAPKGCAVVLTVHDMIHEKFRDMFSPSDKTADIKKIAIERADKIICVSEHTRRDLIELLSVNPEKTCVVHHGFTLTSPPRIEKKDHHSKPSLLYVGSRGSYKNFDRLLEAFADSSFLRKNFTLTAFGGGKFTHVEQDRIQALGLSNLQVIQVAGDDTVLADLYATAAAFIFPSLYEGFGIPPLEAMSFDCPVICSDKSAIPEVVGEAGQYFDPCDITSIREAIEQVVLSPALSSLLVQKGRERIQSFSWDYCANQTMQVYRTLVQK